MAHQLFGILLLKNAPRACSCVPLYPGIFSEAASLEFDEWGLQYHYAEHGITIIIPEDAVSGKARLRVGVALVGPFHFHDNYICTHLCLLK